MPASNTLNIKNYPQRESLMFSILITFIQLCRQCTVANVIAYVAAYNRLYNIISVIYIVAMIITDSFLQALGQPLNSNLKTP